MPLVPPFEVGEISMKFLDRFIDRNVEKYLTSMLATHQTDADFPNLVFDAARVYAQNNGGTSYADMKDSIGCDKEFGGRNYWVFFMRARNGRGTSVTLTQQPSARERMEAELNRFTFSTDASDFEFQQALDELSRLPQTEINKRRPSWDGIDDEMSEFSDYLVKELTASEIAPAYWAKLLQTPETRGFLLSFVAILEDNGSSFSNQKAYAIHLVKQMWERLAPEHKSQFEALGRL